MSPSERWIAWFAGWYAMATLFAISALSTAVGLKDMLGWPPWACLALGGVAAVHLLAWVRAMPRDP